MCARGNMLWPDVCPSLWVLRSDRGNYCSLWSHGLRKVHPIGSYAGMPRWRQSSSGWTVLWSLFVFHRSGPPKPESCRYPQLPVRYVGIPGSGIQLPFRFGHWILDTGTAYVCSGTKNVCNTILCAAPNEAWQTYYYDSTNSVLKWIPNSMKRSKDSLPM